MWFLLHPRTANLDVLFWLPVSLATLLPLVGWSTTILLVPFRCRIYRQLVEGGVEAAENHPTPKETYLTNNSTLLLDCSPSCQLSVTAQHGKRLQAASYSTSTHSLPPSKERNAKQFILQRTLNIKGSVDLK